MQTQLDNLYSDYINRILSETDILEMIENYELSSPLLMDISAARGNYLESEYKILFIGKETNGWFNQREREKVGLLKIEGQNEKYIEELKQLYKRTNIGEKYRKSFFTFIDLLIGRISQNKEVGFTITELLRHDYQCAGASYELATRFAYNNNYILRKEIEILSPNSLIFLTGPNYDKFITHTYPNVEFKSFSNYPIRQVAILEGIPNIDKAVRITHPESHKYKGKQFRHDMVEMISGILNS
jgi:hypothetical protein